MLSYPAVRTISLGPVTVHVWGVFVALAVLAAAWLSARRARRFGLRSVDIWNLAFWVTLGGIVGARALFVAEYWRDYRFHPLRALAIWEGGLSAFGAVLLGFLVAWWYARSRSLPLGRLAAAVSTPLLLADAIGRLGGAASHMYPGRPSTFPISYFADGVQRHEVGLELSLASLGGFFVVLLLERFLGLRSFVPYVVLLWYALERLLLDFLRAADLPSSDIRYAGLPPVAVAEGGLTLAQWLAVAGIVLSLGMMWKRLRLNAFEARTHRGQALTVKGLRTP